MSFVLLRTEGFKGIHAENGLGIVARIIISSSASPSPGAKIRWHWTRAKSSQIPFFLSRGKLLRQYRPSSSPSVCSFKFRVLFIILYIEYASSSCTNALYFGSDVPHVSSVLPEPPYSPRKMRVAKKRKKCARVNGWRWKVFAHDGGHLAAMQPAFLRPFQFAGASLRLAR